MGSYTQHFLRSLRYAQEHAMRPRDVEYHTPEWEALVEKGWTTAIVTCVPGQPRMARMVYIRPEWRP